MQVQNNLMAKNASRNQKANTLQMTKTLEKLSSGYKINRAGDNAAGLAISEGMRHQINGLDQAMRNVNDGIGLSNTGEGVLAEVHSMLSRMKTLAIQAANATYNSTARTNIEAERLQLLDEIDRSSSGSNFNSIPLFTQEVPASRLPIAPPQKDDEITLQIGHSDEETMGVNRFFMGSEALLLDQTDFTSVTSANKSVTIIDNAIQAVSDMRASFGAAQNHLNHTYNNLGVTRENMTAFESGIRDTDAAETFTKYTSLKIVDQSSQSMMAHANSLPQTILDLLQ